MTNGEPDLQPILRDAWRIPENRRVNELLTDFLHKRNHMAIVVDEYQQTLGVVTIEDALEEIVGEIADEFEEERAKEVVINETEAGLRPKGEYRSISSINSSTGIYPSPTIMTRSLDWSSVISMKSPPRAKRFDIGETTIKVLKANHRQVRRVTTPIKTWLKPNHQPK